MTDNSPATDELIAQIEADIKNGTMGEHHVILSLIARIRAETAKNSGEVVGWMSPRMVAEMKRAAPGYATSIGMSNIEQSPFTVPVFLATPANSRAEAIGEVLAPFAKEAEKWPKDVTDETKIACCSNITVGDLRRALLDNPQPVRRSEAIGIKPLEWKAVRKAVIGADGYEITDMSAGNKQGWRGSFPGENTYRWFSTIEDAQDAAQGHYLRALLQQEGE